MTHEERMQRILHSFRYLGYAFRDVVANARLKDGSVIEIHVPGVVYSEYKGGPNLGSLADWCAWWHSKDYSNSNHVAYVSLKSATPLGRQLEPVQ